MTHNHNFKYIEKYRKIYAKIVGNHLISNCLNYFKVIKERERENYVLNCSFAMLFKFSVSKENFSMYSGWESERDWYESDILSQNKLVKISLKSEINYWKDLIYVTHWLLVFFCFTCISSCPPFTESWSFKE